MKKIISIIIVLLSLTAKAQVIVPTSVVTDSISKNLNIPLTTTNLKVVFFSKADYSKVDSVTVANSIYGFNIPKPASLSSGEYIANVYDGEDAPVVADLFPTGDVTSYGINEAENIDQWRSNFSGTLFSIVANTDSQGGDYAISAYYSGSSAYRQAAIDIPNLNLTPHTATIRARRVSGTGRFLNWGNATNVVYDVDFDSVANGNWITGTVKFTPTSSTVEAGFYPLDNDGSTEGNIEVNEIIVTEDE